MSEFVLLSGNLNYSSWSSRAWLALKLAGIRFETMQFNLAAEGERERIRQQIPSGRVPALLHRDLLIWDSLSIAEYLVEQCPDKRLWPDDRGARAVARSVCAEMHSAFPDLRTRMPLNVRRSSPGRGGGGDVDGDIRRIEAIWGDCRRRFGERGPYLFGHWCLADVFYAPVVSRFRTYQVDTDSICDAYRDALWDQPHVSEWRRLAEAESWSNPRFDL